MGVFNRFKTGFGMARRSNRVLRAYKKLLILPLIGGLSGIAFLVTLFGSLCVTTWSFQTVKNNIQ
mgnify:CR=1 FL=1